MSNYNHQQQSVILKGIAQNVLQMNVPTFEVVSEKLLKEFGYEITQVSKGVKEIKLHKETFGGKAIREAKAYSETGEFFMAFTLLRGMGLSIERYDLMSKVEIFAEGDMMIAKIKN